MVEGRSRTPPAGARPASPQRPRPTFEVGAQLRLGSAGAMAASRMPEDQVRCAAPDPDAPLHRPCPRHRRPRRPCRRALLLYLGPEHTCARTAGDKRSHVRDLIPFHLIRRQVELVEIQCRCVRCASARSWTVSRVPYKAAAAAATVAPSPKFALLLCRNHRGLNSAWTALHTRTSCASPGASACRGAVMPGSGRGWTSGVARGQINRCAQNWQHLAGKSLGQRPGVPSCCLVRIPGKRRAKLSEEPARASRAKARKMTNRGRLHAVAATRRQGQSQLLASPHGLEADRQTHLRSGRRLLLVLLRDLPVDVVDGLAGGGGGRRGLAAGCLV